MGRRSSVSGIRPKGKHRIEFEIWIGKKRYRPTIERPPTPANLRRARIQLDAIDKAIANGTFDFAQEFPHYRLKGRVPPPMQAAQADEDSVEAFQESFDVPEAFTSPVCGPTASAPVAEAGADHRKKTCGEIFDAFLAHCQARVAMSDMAYSTFSSYQQILERVWRPRIGEEIFEEVIYSRLQSIVSSYAAKIEDAAGGKDQVIEGGARNGEPLAKRTYNNIVSAVRCAFEHGYRDFPEKHNPALRLKTLRITKKDKEPPDPFTIQDAELIIARSHQEFGAAHGNYEEFRFFTGLRQSEQFALKVRDCDLARGKIRVERARVRRREKDRTKTNEDREIELCGRALEVLKRQLALRDTLVTASAIHHEFVFFQADGSPLVHLSYPWKRWRYVLGVIAVRYRDPYNARHSFISWSLMINKNWLKLAQEDGHSPQTMLTTYAAWIKGATDEDIAMIEQAMEHSRALEQSPQRPLESPESATTTSLGSKKDSWGRLSWRKNKHIKGLKWRSGRPPM